MKNQDFTSLIKIEKNNKGKVVAIDTDMQKANFIRAKITASIQEELSFFQTEKISISLGSLTGIQTFNDRGPEIPLKFSMSGNVSANFRSDFLSAGINQTKHQIYLDIKTQVLILTCNYPTETTVETSILIAETIIVSETPNFWLGKN